MKTTSPTNLFVDESDSIGCEFEDASRAKREREILEEVTRRQKRRKNCYVKPPSSSTQSTTMDGFGEMFKDLIREKLEHPGRTMLIAPAGVGKTYNSARVLIEKLSDDKRVYWATATNATAREASDTLREHHDAEDVQAALDALTSFKNDRAMRLRRGRGKDTCERYSVGARANELAPNGWSSLCDGCQYREAGTCPFWNHKSGGGFHDAQLEIVTHKMLTLLFPKLDKPRTLTSINWRQIAEAAHEGGMFVPWVRQTGSAKVLELRAREDGSELAPLDVTTSEDEDGNETFELTHTGQVDALRWLASERDVEATREAVLTAYATQTDEWVWGDALVIDESILENTISQITLDASQFALFATRYELPNDLANQFLDWLAEPRGYVGPDQMANVIDQYPDVQARLADVEAQNAKLIEEAAPLLDDGEAMDVMAPGIDWRTQKAWARFIAKGTREGYISQGKLHLPWHSPIDFEGFRNVIILDATGTEGIARALLGEESECIDIAIEDAPRPLVIHIECDLPKSDIEDGAFRTKYRDDVAKSLLLFDSEKTLYFIHKAMADNLEEAHPLSRASGEVLYFLCSEARGSNKYKDFERGVFHTFFENQQAAQALAFTMCEAAGDDWNDLLVREDWLDQAHFQKGGAVLIQSAERIRPIRATEDAPREMVFSGHRDPSGLGFEVDLALSPTELALLATGESHNRGQWRSDPLLIKLGVDVLGGAWAPAIENGPSPHKCLLATGSSELFQRHLWKEKRSERAEFAWNRTWTAIYKACNGFICGVAVGETGKVQMNPLQAAQNQPQALIEVLDRCSSGHRSSLMEEIGFKTAKGWRPEGGAPAHVYHFEDVTLEQLVVRYRDAFERIEMDDGSSWSRDSTDVFWSFLEREVGEHGLDVVLAWSSREIQQKIRQRAEMVGSEALGSWHRVRDAFREVARRHAPGSTNHAEVIRALLEDRYRTPFIELESSDRVVIECRDWPEYVEPGSIDHRYFYPWEGMDVVRPTRFVSGALALDESPIIEVNFDAGVDMEMYDQERRRWRIWSMKAPGNLMHLWPDVSVWSRRKAAGLLPVDYPEGFEQMCMRPGGEQLEWMYRQLESERILPPQPPAPGAALEASPVWRGLDAGELARELEGSPVMMEVARKLHDLVACWEPELDEAVVRDQLTTLFHRHGRYRLAGIAWGMAVLGTRFVGEEWEKWTWRLYLLVHQLEDDALPEPIRSLTPTQRVAWLLASKGDSCTLEEGLAVPAARRRTRSPDASSGHGALNIWRNQLVTARRWLNEGINVNPLSGGDFTRQWEEAGERGEILRMPGAKPLDADALISLWGAGVRSDESDVWGGEDYQAWKIGLAFGHLSASGKPIGISPLWAPWMDNALASWRDFAPEALRGHDFLDLSEGAQLEFIRWRLQAESLAAGEDVYHVPWRGLRAMNILKALHDRHDALLTPLHHPALPEMGVPVKPGSSWYLAGESAPLPLLDVYERWMGSGPAETLPYVLWRTRLRFVLSNSAGIEELVFSIEDTATLAFREHEISFWDLHELDQLTLLREHALALAAHHYRPPHWQVEWCVERYDGVYYPLEVECPSLGEANSVLRFILPARETTKRG